jgi:hypothetical protein
MNGKNIPGVLGKGFKKSIIFSIFLFVEFAAYCTGAEKVRNKNSFQLSLAMASAL